MQETKIIKLADVKPEFTTYETTTAGLTNDNVGNTLRAVLNVKVLEKTKSYIILRINFIHILQTKRMI